MRVRLSIRPTPEKVRRVFGELPRRLQDWRPAWHRLKPFLPAGLAEVIESEGTLLGERWAPLSEAYARRKALEGHGRTMFVHSGRLLGSLHAARGGGTLSKTQLSYYPRERYGFVLHRGGGKSKVPARRWIGWTPEMTERAVAALERRADELLAQTAAQLGEG